MNRFNKILDSSAANSPNPEKRKRLNEISANINSHIDHLNKSKDETLRPYERIHTLDDNGVTIPDHLLRINKDIALSLNVKPSDKYFVFWFALSSYFPLAASCLGPLANMISIAALVDRWREDADGTRHPDPPWVLAINSISIAVGTISDISLIMNFSKRLNYLIAQTISIIGWFIASVLLISIIFAVYVDSFKNHQLKPTEGYWFAAMTAVIYLMNSFLLLMNLIGHLLNKYSEGFNLDSAQRGLIFYTLTFAIWLSIGAAIFTKLIGINYGTSLYFCVVSVTTVGLGDIVPASDGAKAFVLVYAIVGLLFLGLIITTVRQMVLSNNEPLVFWSQVEKRRKKLYRKYRDLIKSKQENADKAPASAENSSPETIRNKQAKRPVQEDSDDSVNRILSSTESDSDVVLDPEAYTGLDQLKGRLTLRQLHSLASVEDIGDEDMFKIMELVRRVSYNYQRFLSLLLTVIVFVSFWLIGAAAFLSVEGWRYFDGVYFCFLCLLTIGYGVPSPTSPFGRAFFVCWAVGAVPLNTILISNVGDTLFIICVDYSDKVTNFVFSGRFKRFSPFHNEEIGPEVKITEPPLPSMESDLVSRSSNVLAEHSLQELPLIDQTKLRAEGDLQGLALTEMLASQKDILELMEILEMIREILQEIPEDLYQGVHKSYEDWNKLKQIYQKTTQMEEAEEDKMFWISEKSPLKYPLDENNYFVYRYIKILEAKMNKFLKHQVGNYNDYLKSIEDRKKLQKKID